MPATTCPRCHARVEFKMLGERTRAAQRVRAAYWIPRGNPDNRPTNWIEAGPGGWVWIDHTEVCPERRSSR